MIEYLIPTALYAETHFRFLGLSPNALFRREPEIVFDLPRRLTPNADLPVALLINDAARYPIHIESVQITAALPGTGDKPRLFEFDPQAVNFSEINHPLKNQQRSFILTIPRGELPIGEIFVNACLRYRRIKNGIPRGKVYAVFNDNLVTSTKFAYRCLSGGDNYPGDGLCAYGDLHCHSAFSRSHVEWGPPIEVIDRVAGASGLRFAAVTDHSYDLACEPDNFLRQDKNLRLWELYKSSINSYKGATTLIPSEEISVLNSEGSVVHLCGLGLTDYIPGSLDGARKNIRGDKQLTIEEAVREIERQGGVSFAAHPGAQTGIFQSVFLRRGEWSGKDLCAGLGGVQAVNSDFFGSWIRAKNLWVSTLQKGRRIPILAGSDAHGDFNRYRAIGVPFWRIHEGAERYMGFVRTGIYGKRDGIGDIINGIRNAETFVTNGPFVTICDRNNPAVSLIGSKTVSIANTTNICARAISTDEFGAINAVKIIMGAVGQPEEKVIVDQQLTTGSVEVTIPIPVNELPQNENLYLRVEARGKTPRGFATTAASSACFIA